MTIQQALRLLNRLLVRCFSVNGPYFYDSYAAPNQSVVNFLLDVNLQHMPDEYLAGEWRVADRVLNCTDPNSAIAKATRFRLQPETPR